MPKVIFDSSFLMAVVERPTTWFEDITDELGRFEPVLLDCVASELKRLAEGEGKKARYASLALEIGAKFDSLACGGASVDDELVSAALAQRAVVATADREIGGTLRASRIRVMGLSRGRVRELR
ncbi:MAG: hypothetical protein HY297_02730 [Thaumarchaeota archaeon]|nr:hypothetical protein [Nitrososphaerota archaeon]